MNNLLKSRSVRFVLLATGTALAGAAISHAAIPGADGVISGCYEKRTGIMRVIDADQGKTCTSWETPLVWNRTGPAGPQGAQGPQGEKGDSASATLVERREISFLAGNSDAYLSAYCAPGERATGGGGWTGGNGVYMMASYSVGQPPTQWSVRYQNTGDVSAAINAFVICSSP